MHNSKDVGWHGKTNIFWQLPCVPMESPNLVIRRLVMVAKLVMVLACQDKPYRMHQVMIGPCPLCRSYKYRTMLRLEVHLIILSSTRQPHITPLCLLPLRDPPQLVLTQQLLLLGIMWRMLMVRHIQC